MLSNAHLTSHSRMSRCRSVITLSWLSGSWRSFSYSSSVYFRRRQWHPTPVLLPRKSHGWRSLVGCSPWDCEELDMTEQLHFDFSLSCIGEGNSNPLWCSCLENPGDRGAWWAAVYGVTQSRTQLKWLSSSTPLQLVLPDTWNLLRGYKPCLKSYFKMIVYSR